VMRRREFLYSAAALATPLDANQSLDSRLCLFTDHLAGFGYDEVARMLAELKVAGPDLTVRRGGLVPPDRVAEELPKAARVFKERGLTIPMITTSITAADETARSILTAASHAGIRYYKLGYFAYKDLNQWQQTVDQTRRQLQSLAELGRSLGIRAGMHNHAGDTVGCDLWDSWEALKDVDPGQVGFFFDPAHANIEGAKTGWKLSFRRLAPRLFMLALKDYVWEKTADGWKTRWVPLGQGMVPWPELFALLKTVSWPGPVSLHIEYNPGGSTKTERYDRSLDAAARDLRFLRDHWQGAGS